MGDGAPPAPLPLPPAPRPPPRPSFGGDGAIGVVTTAATAAAATSKCATAAAFIGVTPPPTTTTAVPPCATPSLPSSALPIVIRGGLGSASAANSVGDIGVRSPSAAPPPTEGEMVGTHCGDGRHPPLPAFDDAATAGGDGRSLIVVGGASVRGDSLPPRLRRRPFPLSLLARLVLLVAVPLLLLRLPLWLLRRRCLGSLAPTIAVVAESSPKASPPSDPPSPSPLAIAVTDWQNATVEVPLMARLRLFSLLVVFVAPPPPPPGTSSDSTCGVPPSDEGQGVDCCGPA